MRSQLDRFYELLRELENEPEQGCRLSECTGRMVWPNRGVYFFRKPGEYRSDDPKTLRIVRVGTHAVSAGSKSKRYGSGFELIEEGEKAEATIEDRSSVST